MSLISSAFTLEVKDEPTWLASRPNTLQWYSVSGVTISTTGSGSGICAYSGATIDKTNSVLYLNGGGHSDYGGNEVLKLDLQNDTLAWAVARASGSGSGRPVARHTWYDIIFSHTRSKMMLMGGKVIYPDVNSDNVIHAFNPATGDWDSAASISYTALPGVLNTNICNGVVEDGAGAIWYANDNFKVSKFLADGTWSNLTDEGTTDSYSWGGAYDPLNDRVVMFRGANSAWWNATTNARTGFNMSGATKDGSPIWCDDLADFLYLQWDGNTVRRVDNNTYSVSTLSLSGTAPPAPSNDGYGNICGRFFYCPNLHIVGYVRDTTTDFYFFRTA